LNARKGLDTEWHNGFLEVTIIPGSLNSSHPTEKFIFQPLLPLEAEEREEAIA
jgi:hypothetical protein